MTRYFVRGETPKDVRQRYTRGVRAHIFESLKPEDEAMEASGWCALERPFDLELNATKLFEGSVLLVGFRVDRWRVPAALLNAQLADEEQKLLAKSGKKKLGRAERAELKQKLTLRLRRKITPATKAFDVCWDLEHGTVLFFSHSARVKDVFEALFEQSFGLSLAEDSPYLAAQRAGLSSRELSNLASVEPTRLITPAGQADAAAAGSVSTGEAGAPVEAEDLVERIETTRFLGPEFLLWLWVRGQLVSGNLTLTGSGDLDVWLDSQLVLQSPVDPAESVVVRGVAPADGAEAREAVRAQKFPVSARVVVRTREGDFSLTLKAAQFAIASAAVPAVLTGEADDAFADRLDRLRQLFALLDALFARFLRERLAPVWADAWEPALSAWVEQRDCGPALLQKLHGVSAAVRSRSKKPPSRARA